MTTQTRNPNSEGESALRKRFDGWEYGDQWHAALDEALAAERRLDHVCLAKALYMAANVFIDEKQALATASTYARLRDEDSA